MDEDKRLPLPTFSPVVYRYINGDATFSGDDAPLALALSREAREKRRGLLTPGEQTLFPAASDAEVTEPASGVAPRSGRVSLRYQDVRERWILEGSTDIAAGQCRVATTILELETEGYRTVDLRAAIAPVRRINRRGEFRDLFDETFVNYLNSKNSFSGEQIPEPGLVL